MNDALFSLFAVVPPGLESIAFQELVEIGVTGPILEKGGVTFSTDLTHLVRAHVALGSAAQILLRLHTFLAPSIPQFVKRAAQINWEDYLKNTDHLSIQVSTAKSKIYHSKKLEQLLLEAIKKKVPGVQVLKEDAGQSIHVTLKRNICNISISTTGQYFYRRGYRVHNVHAPIRENLAFGILKLAKWDGSIPLVDPMCGSGTVVIEASKIAAGIPPHRGREFPFESWPCMGKWHQQISDQKQILNPRSSSVPILGFDRDPQAIAACQVHAERAGVMENTTFARQAFETLTLATSPGILIINPPYGKRIAADRETNASFKKISWILKERFGGWQVIILCPDKALAKVMKLPFKSLALLNHGGIRIYIMHALI